MKKKLTTWLRLGDVLVPTSPRNVMSWAIVTGINHGSCSITFMTRKGVLETVGGCSRDWLWQTDLWTVLDDDASS